MAVFCGKAICQIIPYPKSRTQLVPHLLMLLMPHLPNSRVNRQNSQWQETVGSWRSLWLVPRFLLRRVIAKWTGLGSLKHILILQVLTQQNCEKIARISCNVCTLSPCFMVIVMWWTTDYPLLISDILVLLLFSFFLYFYFLVK